MIDSAKTEVAGISALVERMAEVQVNMLDARKCETPIQLGFFFDGTKNNVDVDEPRFAQSNVARLWRSYSNQPSRGIFSQYIPGVGTPFNDIERKAEGWEGTGFGIGCEARVLFALMQVLEFLNSAIGGNQKLFTKIQKRILCTCTDVTRRSDLNEILKLGRSRGLQECVELRGAVREDFFRRELIKLERTMSSSPVRITQCLIDVFGFSRGAAEARVFANWLGKMLISGRLAGIPLTVRFIGLFDTVASAGLRSGILGAVTNTTRGHDGWADSAYLRVDRSVRNCVHFVAMHEVRKNFPLEELAVDGRQPKHFIQIAYPGSHSDVGGGYEPGALGIAVAADSRKISQLPLNHMYEYAVKAGVPLDKNLLRLWHPKIDPFAVDPELIQDYSKFLDASGRTSRRMHEWMEKYLAWRWQRRNSYSELNQVQQAKADRSLLVKSNRKLIFDAEYLIGQQGSGFLQSLSQSVAVLPFGAMANLVRDLPVQLDPEAATVLKKAMGHGWIDKRITDFFDKYVHDSYAGFSAILEEPTGYWRYRRCFQGTEKVLFA